MGLFIPVYHVCEGQMINECAEVLQGPGILWCQVCWNWPCPLCRLGLKALNES